jgi:hypothetical protein
MRTLLILVLTALVPASWNIINQDEKTNEKLTEADLKEYGKYNAGTTWTYKSDISHSGINSATTFIKMAVVKHKDGVTFFDGEPSMFLAVKDGYLVNGYVGQDGELVYSMRILKAGLTKGDSFDPYITDNVGTVKCTFEGFEDVEVPAGKFRAICIKWEATAEEDVATKVVLKFWYAPKVGAVKSTIENNIVKGVRVLEKYTIK